MNKFLTLFAAAAAVFLLAACGSAEAPKTAALAAPAAADPVVPPSEAFKRYWYQGQAEVSSYDLEQARYGALRDAEAVLIFVTEDLSRSKQVKLDNPEAAGADRVPVLKLNLTKKFNTGIYPYSMMQSVFTPVELGRGPAALKATMTAQEWCGQVFSQINLGNEGYRARGYSYFESEGDAEYSLGKHLLEDEIWTRIRIAPDQLPLGDMTLVPALFYHRLKHTEHKPEAASATLQDEGEARVYRISYKNSPRTLSIRFQAAFPHQILGWEESYPDGWGPGAAVLTTRATLKKTMMLDYWTRNKPEDLPLRRELGLEF
ncbi:MAG: hypothetical protein NW241_00150 [Bacteroidia bacterium]|nr:hypothetical protein [Bacteroidia bacterium]